MNEGLKSSWNERKHPESENDSNKKTSRRNNWCDVSVTDAWEKGGRTCFKGSSEEQGGC